MLLHLPNVSWPGMDRVKGMQKGWPEDILTGGKKGSFCGMVIGKHSGWTV